MDKLPPELLLKIAGYCNFASVCTMSKLNRRCNEVIESNWNSLKKVRLEHVQLAENEDYMIIVCVMRKKHMSLNLWKGSENVNPSEVLENGWICDRQINNQFVVRPMDADKFLEDFFMPIFLRSNIHKLLLRLKSSTLQVMVALLDRFRPTIGTLDMVVGSMDSYHHGVQLTDSARIVELSKPDRLGLWLSDGLPEEEIREFFLKKIANLYIPSVRMSGEWANSMDPRTRQSSMHGPLPKCKDLVCEGKAFKKFSALGIPDIVDLVEEWSNNERDIKYYQLLWLSDSSVIAAKFEEALKERNLPKMPEDAEFLIEKIAMRGDEQDQLRLKFCGDVSDNFVDIYTGAYPLELLPWNLEFD